MEIEGISQNDSVWNRISTQLTKRGMSLKTMTEIAGLNYGSVKVQKSRGTLTKTDDAIAIANTLGMSLDFLLTGKEAEPFSNEALEVEKDDRLKAVVRACLRDEHYLLLVSSSIMTTEANASKEIFV